MDDPYDDASPRHKWGPIKLTGGQAARKLGGLVKGSFRGIKVVKRGVSPRIVRAEVLGSRGRTAVTGPVLRKRFGLNDTWAYFRYVSATTKRTPAPAPPGPMSRSPPPPVDPSGGTSPTTTTTGPAARAAALDAPARGWATLSGRILPARKGALLRLQVRERGRWHTVRLHARRQGRRLPDDAAGPRDLPRRPRRRPGPAVRAR